MSRVKELVNDAFGILTYDRAVTDSALIEEPGTAQMKCRTPS